MDSVVITARTGLRVLVWLGGLRPVGWGVDAQVVCYNFIRSTYIHHPPPPPTRKFVPRIISHSYTNVQMIRIHHIYSTHISSTRCCDSSHPTNIHSLSPHPPQEHPAAAIYTIYIMSVFMSTDEWHQPAHAPWVDDGWANQERWRTIPVPEPGNSGSDSGRLSVYTRSFGGDCRAGADRQDGKTAAGSQSVRRSPHQAAPPAVQQTWSLVVRARHSRGYSTA